MVTQDAQTPGAVESRNRYVLGNFRTGSCEVLRGRRRSSADCCRNAGTTLVRWNWVKISDLLHSAAGMRQDTLGSHHILRAMAASGTVPPKQIVETSRSARSAPRYTPAAPERSEISSEKQESPNNSCSSMQRFIQPSNTFIRRRNNANLRAQGQSLDYSPQRSPPSQNNSTRQS